MERSRAAQNARAAAAASLFVGSSSSPRIPILSGQRNGKGPSGRAPEKRQGPAPTLLQGFVGNEESDEDEEDVQVVEPATTSMSRTRSQDTRSPSLLQDQASANKRQLRDASLEHAGSSAHSNRSTARGSSTNSFTASRASPKASSSRVTLEHFPWTEEYEDDDADLEEVEVTQQHPARTASTLRPASSVADLRRADDGSIRRPLSRSPLATADAGPLPPVKVEVISDNEDDDDDDIVEVAPPPGSTHHNVLPRRQEVPEVFSLSSSSRDPRHSAAGDATTAGDEDDGGFIKEEEDIGQAGAPSSILHAIGRYGKHATKQRVAANGGKDPFEKEDDARYRARLEQEEAESRGEGGCAQGRAASKTPVPFVRDEPWPEHFVKLEKTFKAVNIVYAFCSARKHMAPTFDIIRSGTEGLLKR